MSEEAESNTQGDGVHYGRMIAYAALAVIVIGAAVFLATELRFLLGLLAMYLGLEALAQARETIYYRTGRRAAVEVES